MKLLALWVLICVALVAVSYIVVGLNRLAEERRQSRSYLEALGRVIRHG